MEQPSILQPVDLPSADEEIVFCGRTATELWRDAEHIRRNAIDNWGFDEVTALRTAVSLLKSSGLLHQGQVNVM